MDTCSTRWPGTHLTLGRWSSVVSSSVFQEGADKPPRSPQIARQTVSSELHGQSRWLCGDLQASPQRRMNWMALRDSFIPVCGRQLYSGVAGDDFHEGSASVKILRSPLVERTWLDSTTHLSYMGSVTLSTGLGTKTWALDSGLPLCQPEMSRVGSLIVVRGLLATVR